MEQSFLAWLRGRQRALPQVAVGIGDDAAVIDLSAGRQLVASTDTVIDQVDFLWGQHAANDIGYKAMAVNLSDIAAMGGRAESALVTLSLPTAHAAAGGEGPTQTAAAVYEGILQAAEQYGIAIAGGDLSVYDGPLSISITLLGSVPAGQAWLRGGAQEEDVLVVTGPLGGSLLGRHLRPQPRLDLVQPLRQADAVHAAMDISDGFSLDLDRLCSASGVGAEIDTSKLPIHNDAVRRSAQSGRKPLDHALGDGEDFELILAISPAGWQRLQPQAEELGLTAIGRFIGRTGLWNRTGRGLQRMLASGFIHGHRRSDGLQDLPHRPDSSRPDSSRPDSAGLRP